MRKTLLVVTGFDDMEGGHQFRMQASSGIWEGKVMDSLIELPEGVQLS